MTDPTPPDSTAADLIDEAARRDFERAWREGASPPLEQFLPAPDHPGFLATLLELVLIDLEFGWKAPRPATADTADTPPGDAAPPRVEDYLARFPALRPAAGRLLREEYRLRHRFGDRPEASEYLGRFPDLSLGSQEFDGPSPQPFPAVPGYEIEGVLGRGGMGVVYRARQVSLNRVVALKMISAGALAGADEVARFRREAEAVARLGHPNVVHVYEVGEWDGRPYFAMEFVAGGGLDKLLAGTPQPPRWSAELAEILARAVQAVHERGIVHRDLKPGNVLIVDGGWWMVNGKDREPGPGVAPNPAEAGAPGQPSTIRHPPSTTCKIADFGLAKSLTGAATQTASGAAVGTPSYMAPEQAEGKKDVGPAADVYALGAILYECLTGRPPFKAATGVETLNQVRTQEPVPPSRLAPQVPRDLETICLKCLHKEPRRRYDSARAMAEDLGRFLAGEPVRARPTPAWERGLKWARRKPAAAALVLVSLAAALALLAVGLVYNAALHDALDEATTRRAEAEANLEEARGNFGLAREAVDDYLTRAGTDARLRGQDLEAVRHDLLRSALAFYQKLAGRRHGDTPELRGEQALAYYRLASLTAELGERGDAVGHYRRAVTLLEPLARERPDRTDLRITLGRAYGHLGNLYRETGKPGPAEDALRRALEVHGRLAEERPGDVACRSELAGSQMNLGRLHQALGRNRDAEKAYREALGLRRRLVGERPDSESLRASLANTWTNVGQLCRVLGRDGEAADAYGEALRLWTALTKARPGEPDYQTDLVRIHVALGQLHQRARRWDESVAAFREALNIQEPLAETYPRILDYQATLGAVYHGLGLVLRLRGEMAQAEAVFGKALKVRDRLVQAHPDGVPQQADLADTCRYLALIHKELGRFDEAEKGYLRAQDILERLARQEPQTPGRQADLATNYTNLTTLYMARGQLDRARATCCKGLDLYRRLATKNPEVVSFRVSRGYSQATLGAIYNDLRQLEPAEQANREAVRLRQELTEEHPKVAAYQVNLADSHNSLGMTLLLQSRTAAAEKELNAARKILEELARAGPAPPDQRLSLAATYNNLGKAGQARADRVAALRWFGRAARTVLGLLRDEPRHAQARQWLGVLHGNLAQTWKGAEENDLPAALLYELAGTYALSVAPAMGDPRRPTSERDQLAEGHAAKAVALLRRVRDTSYYGDGGLTERLNSDPAFEALRARADFREVLAGKAGKGPR